MVHIAKYLRNALFRKSIFQCSKLVLPLGFILESRVFATIHIRQLFHESKYKLTCNFHAARNIACIDIMSKQKVSPTLALFARDFATDLKDEFRRSQKENATF